MAADKPLVLVLGATGNTGRSIVNGLLASGKFRVAAAIRPASIFKPATEELRASGVEIRVGDITNSAQDLKKLLDGVEILISAVAGWLIEQQKDILVAAKEVGVKRVIPCDWATPGAKGVRQLHDGKLAIHEFIQELGVPYTFIDVGWWMQIVLPMSTSSPMPQPLKELSWTVLEDVNPRIIATNVDRIGKYVARIIADPRTLNNSVIIWDDEVTQHEAHEIGERASGEEEELKSRRIYVQSDVFKQRAAALQESAKEDPTAAFAFAMNELLHSIFALQENTLENAKRLGYLDVKELYPDLDTYTLKDFAKTLYEKSSGQA